MITDLIQAMRDYMSAYAAKDLAGVGRALADDVVLQDWNLRAKGRAAVLRETARNFEAVQTLQIQIRSTLTHDRTVAAELTILIDGTASLDVVDVLRFNSEGRIVSIRAYKG